MAHFLGASGASRFIRAAEANPDGKAAALFPRAAHANGSVFYDQSGAARSLRQVYAGLVSRHNVIDNATQVADVKPADAVQSASLAAPAPLPRARPIVLPDAVPPTANVASAGPSTVAANGADAAPASAQSTVAATTSAPNAPTTFAERVAMVHEATAMAYASEQPQGPIFQSLYQSDQRGAVAPIVRELWGAPRHATTVDSADAVAPAANTAASGNGAAVNAPLDLFRFLRPSARRPA
jgi:hypothetical protein